MFGAYYVGQSYFGQGPDLVFDVTVSAPTGEIIDVEVSMRRVVAMSGTVRQHVSAAAYVRRRVDIEVER